MSYNEYGLSGGARAILMKMQANVADAQSAAGYGVDSEDSETVHQMLHTLTGYAHELAAVETSDVHTALAGAASAVAAVAAIGCLDILEGLAERAEKERDDAQSALDEAEEVYKKANETWESGQMYAREALREFTNLVERMG